MSLASPTTASGVEETLDERLPEVDRGLRAKRMMGTARPFLVGGGAICDRDSGSHLGVAFWLQRRATIDQGSAGDITTVQMRSWPPHTSQNGIHAGRDHTTIATVPVALGRHPRGGASVMKQAGHRP